MTREQLLARVELDRAQALGQAWRVALIGAALVVGAVWWAGANGISNGTILAAAAGGAVVLMAVVRQAAPKPSYKSGPLEARTTPLGWIAAMAVTAVVVIAALYALTTPDPARRLALLIALAVLMALMLLNWGLSLGAGPVVTIDGRGYNDRRATRGPIPWDQLEPVDVRFVRNQPYYRLRPKDRSRLTWLVRLNALVAFDGFAINGVGLDHGEGDMLLAIHAFRPELIEGI